MSKSVLEHPAVAEACRQVDDLCRTRRAKHALQASRMIRVEITGEIESQIISSAHGFDAWTREGLSVDPMIIRGTSYYFVRSLPAPGWRVVNPFDFE